MAAKLHALGALLTFQCTGRRNAPHVLQCFLMACFDFLWLWRTEGVDGGGRLKAKTKPIEEVLKNKIVVDFIIPE